MNEQEKDELFGQIGWYNSRVREIEYFELKYKEFGYRDLNKTISDVLGEFGFLGGEFKLPDGSYASVSFDIDNWIYGFPKEKLALIEEITEKKLLPIADYGNQSGLFLIAEKGEVYFLNKGGIYFIGSEMHQALENTFKANKDIIKLGEINL